MKWLFPTDICVVTGGNSGLGAAILKEFAKQGCQTVSLDIKPPVSPSKRSKIVNLRDDTGEPTQPALDVATTTLSEKATAPAELDLSETSESSGSIEPNELSESSKASNPIEASEPSESSGPSESSESSESSEPSELSESSDSNGPEASTEELQFSDLPSSLPQDEDEDLSPTLFISCDVRNEHELQKARETILKEFNRHPSIIVLNAGIRRPLNSIVESDFADLSDTLDVNLGGFLKCLRTFLPDMVSNERGFIVSIASALGLVVPKGLGAYGASKAGMIGIHEALEQELEDYNGLHALLVCPGQLGTPMFSDIKTPSALLAPIVPAEKLARKIIKRVMKANTSTLYVPNYVRYLPFLRSVPVPVARLMRKFSGVDKVYDDVVAERKKAAEVHVDECDTLLLTDGSSQGSGVLNIEPSSKERDSSEVSALPEEIELETANETANETAEETASETANKATEELATATPTETSGDGPLLAKPVSPEKLSPQIEHSSPTSSVRRASGIVPIPESKSVPVPPKSRSFSLGSQVAANN